jgi:quercetin dioxygenase-like cupin family protein
MLNSYGVNQNYVVPEHSSRGTHHLLERRGLMKTNLIPLGTMTTLIVVLVGSNVQSVAAPADDPSVDRSILQTVPIEAPVPQQAITGVVSFPPGSSAGHHLHHGSGYVLSGDVEVVSDGEPSRIYHPGDTFVTHRDHPHVSRNGGTTEAYALVTWVVDVDGPLTVPVP